MADDNQESIDINVLDEKIESLARRVASLKRDDPRRVEIVYRSPE